MDGTIVDTEPYWVAAETELIESFGGTWTTDEALLLVGSGLGHSARVLQSKGVRMPENEIIEAMTSSVLARIDEQIPWRPGARELLQEQAEYGVPAALVTMSFRRMAESLANALPAGTFRAIIAGDDVENPKPHPEPYLRAAELLGVAPTDCVAIEDSAPGVQSAIASGAVVIGVPLHVHLTDRPELTLWPSLAQRTLDDIAAVFASARRSPAGRA
jgi:HAD superfamily hydrolase (TIGR01509 family)